MTRHILVIAFSILVAGSIAALWYAASNRGIQWKTFRDDADGFQIAYPATATISTSSFSRLPNSVIVYIAAKGMAEMSILATGARAELIKREYLPITYDRVSWSRFPATGEIDFAEVPSNGSASVMAMVTTPKATFVIGMLEYLGPPDDQGFREMVHLHTLRGPYAHILQSFTPL